MKRMLFVMMVAVGLSACADVAPETKDLSSGKDAPELVAQGIEGWEISEFERPIESEHPYGNNLGEGDSVQIVRAPEGAVAFRIHFDALRTERGYDWVDIHTADGEHIQRVSGATRGGWSDTIPGDTARVSVRSDYSITDFGYAIDSVEYQPAPEPETGGQWHFQGLPADNEISTEHPYANNELDKWTITGIPEAQKVRVHFTGFDVERGYDFVHLYDGEGQRVATYTGAKGDFVSVEVPGNVVTIELETDYSVTDYGFDVAAYEVFVDDMGCGSDADCGEGQRCEQVQCIRWPCPALCVDVPVACEANTDCPVWELCNNGTCEGVVCPQVVDPVCGVDGETYSNACSANAQHVGIAYDGPCSQVCGTRGAGTCGEGMYCHHEPSAMCGWADAPGNCREIPELCTREYAPVCGCDGRTHSNACNAAGSSTGILHEGACEDDEEPTEPVLTCQRGGCSGQMCVPEGEPAFSTCEWRDEYACLQRATCEVQENGTCGFTMTEEVESCLEEAGGR